MKAAPKSEKQRVQEFMKEFLGNERTNNAVPEVALPECDEFGTPKEKMPLCPKCGEDELGMMQPGHAFCYACGFILSQVKGETQWWRSGKGV